VERSIGSPSIDFQEDARMSADETIAPDEIARRITTGMGLVYDLFNEMNSFFRLLVQGLEAADAGIHPRGPKGFLLPKRRQRANPADRFVKTDMGLFAEIGGVVGDDSSEEESDDLESESEEDEEPEMDKASISITPESRFLGVRAILYEPSKSQSTPFTPVVVAALLTSATRARGKKQKFSKPETAFQVKRGAFRRLVKELHPVLEPQQQISRRVPGQILSATITAREVLPLAHFDSEDKVNDFIETLVQMAES
jgi:hypothetical protein